MDDAVRRFLARTRRGFLATADRDGRPAAVPVCFALLATSSDDGANADETRADAGTTPDPDLVSPLDEKPKDVPPGALRRVRDVRANPHVALTVDRYDEDWSALAWVQVRGTARLVEPGSDGHGDAVAALRAKYDQYADHALAERPLLRVAPGHVVSWAADDSL